MSVRLSPKMVHNFVCQTQCRKTVRLYVDVLGIFATMLKGDMLREEYLSMERGRWKCYKIRAYIASALSAITEILPESAR